ncbi:MAG: metallophosphoesterase [Planctomycetia bacterium]|nr:metallophosphoesterase [Planctomycetia bacterium]
MARRRRWAHWLGRNWARVSYGFRVEPTWLELNHFDVPMPGLPAEFVGLRIVQLTDFHCSRQVGVSYLQEAVALAQFQQADLAVLTGDFIHKGYQYVERVAEVLGTLSAPLGVHAVLGNHDFSVRNALGIRRYRQLHQAVTDALTARGVNVLRNQSVLLRRGDSALHLAGVDDLWSRCCDLDRAFAGIDPEQPRIVLAHNPQTIDRLGKHRCDLMLSGHTHGGQVNWPGLGRPMLSKRAKRFAAGLYQHNGSYLYVNKGVGFGFRFRFGVRPEVAVATLKQA